MNGNDAPRHVQTATEQCDVCVVGAGPAGLMLACTLARFGIHAVILDERPDQTAVGRADGIQPKTIETFRMLGIGDELMRVGKRIYDICIWRGSSSDKLCRTNRETHYPDSIVDLLEPYILIGHQGLIEKVFLDDLRQRGVEVKRSHHFKKCHVRSGLVSHPVVVQSSFGPAEEERAFEAEYVVGCDGAHSSVRSMILEDPPRTSGTSVWGVLDGELETDFPDIWSKTVIFSEEHGSILIIPREKNMTRFYIEMKETASSKNLGEDFVKQRARDILSPHRLEWRSVEWFGKYQVAQKVAAKFSDPNQRVFIAGDASHAHSPKAAQGANTSVHDTWNLGWKLNLAARGLAKPILLQSYEDERQKVARDLIDFDYEHANHIAAGDPAALAENFRKNIRFISGVGAEYAGNAINSIYESTRGNARPGCNLPPAKATRYYDANPIDLQLDIPVLGQFRTYIFLKDITSSQDLHFLASLSDKVLDPRSFTAQLSNAASKSYQKKPRLSAPGDIYTNPERYTTVSQLFTPALITPTEKALFEISGLPALMSRSPWTVYLDDARKLDTRGESCTKKWLGSLSEGEAAIVNVRPDGYVGSISRWNTADDDSGRQAAKWLDVYYEGFLQIPSTN
ncbi:FAD binding domain-containing protein [Xylariales sp. AK1849]|nr:FAD binding domain-containing protein [Xylariales sp. AK1849]